MKDFYQLVRCMAVMNVQKHLVTVRIMVLNHHVKNGFMIIVNWKFLKVKIKFRNYGAYMNEK